MFVDRETGQAVQIIAQGGKFVIVKPLIGEDGDEYPLPLDQVGEITPALPATDDRGDDITAENVSDAIDILLDLIESGVDVDASFAGTAILKTMKRHYE